MAKLSKDQIGDLGELLAAADLSRPVAGRFGRPLFRATSLGGKYPTVDFLVDLLADDSVKIPLYEEVLSFWNAVKNISFRTRFTDA